jgi:hypothetical protein
MCKGLVRVWQFFIAMFRRMAEGDWVGWSIGGGDDEDANLESLRPAAAGTASLDLLVESSGPDHDRRPEGERTRKAKFEDG